MLPFKHTHTETRERERDERALIQSSVMRAGRIISQRRRRRRHRIFLFSSSGYNLYLRCTSDLITRADLSHIAYSETEGGREAERNAIPSCNLFPLASLASARRRAFGSALVDARIKFSTTFFPLLIHAFLWLQIIRLSCLFLLDFFFPVATDVGNKEGRAADHHHPSDVPA